MVKDEKTRRLNDLFPRKNVRKMDFLIVAVIARTDRIRLRLRIKDETLDRIDGVLLGFLMLGLLMRLV